MPSNTLFRVLCVDDDADAGEMLGLLLKSYLVEVTCVQTAAQAWAKLSAERFDLLVLDVWLPVLDGFDFCRQIRETDSLTPILFYSGAAYDVDKIAGLAAGANAYLVKPNVDGLLEAVAELIAKKNSSESASQAWSNQIRPLETLRSRQGSAEAHLD